MDFPMSVCAAPCASARASAKMSLPRCASEWRTARAPFFPTQRWQKTVAMLMPRRGAGGKLFRCLLTRGAARQSPVRRRYARRSEERRATLCRFIDSVPQRRAAPRDATLAADTRYMRAPPHKTLRDAQSIIFTIFFFFSDDAHR
jgi:hypothetical protein